MNAIEPNTTETPQVDDQQTQPYHAHICHDEWDEAWDTEPHWHNEPAVAVPLVDDTYPGKVTV